MAASQPLFLLLQSVISAFFPELLCYMGWVTQKSTMRGHSRPLRALLPFPSLSEKPAVLTENTEFRKTVCGEDFSCL